MCVTKLSLHDPEPPCGSIVLIHGTTGTAYQRMHRHGQWMRPKDDSAYDWATLLGIASREVLLVYLAPEEN